MGAEEGSTQHSKGPKLKVTGDTAALKDNVYPFGAKNQADMYIKTTEAIANYVGKEYGKAMRLLVKGIDVKPEEPVAPRKAAVDDDLTFARDKYKMEMNRYLKKLDEYNENKAKVFVIIRGQCTLTMRSHLDNLKEIYPQLEKDDDVIGLLKLLKELSFTTINAHYEYWTKMQSMRRFVNVQQLPRESLASYYRRWKAPLEVLEAQWGDFGPTIHDNNDTDSQARDKLLACLFLNGCDRKRYGKVIEELSHAHLAGQENYPGTVEAMMMMLSH